MVKKIIPYLNCENEISNNIIAESIQYEISGADGLYLFNYSKDEASRNEFLMVVKEVIDRVDLPVLIGMYVERFEDIKKALYTGAEFMVIQDTDSLNYAVIQEGISRFGKDKIIIELEDSNDIYKEDKIRTICELGIYAIQIKHAVINEAFMKAIDSLGCFIIVRDSLSKNDLGTILTGNNILGIATNYFNGKEIWKVKKALKVQGINVITFESSLSFDEFKKNEEGLLPVVVQEYKTKEVLMVAYMNAEAYQKTIDTGKMTYYSRSRQELWVKGETSGHYQYVKSLYIDCDKDTILAEIQQVGSACHTGNTSCFYTNLVKKEYEDLNPMTVFHDVYQVIADRKKNPKEGSYTNYLFDKGIDKILKKCGEEATEIVIAAKNPEKEELKYEISDYLYHMMVLMVECGVDWKDIVMELAHRR